MTAESIETFWDEQIAPKLQSVEAGYGTAVSMSAVATRIPSTTCAYPGEFCFTQAKNSSTIAHNSLIMARYSCSPCTLAESRGFSAKKNGAPAGTPSSALGGSLNPAAGETDTPGFAVNEPLATKPVSSRSMLNVICENFRRTAFCRRICAIWNFTHEAASRSATFVPSFCARAACSAIIFCWKSARRPMPASVMLMRHNGSALAADTAGSANARFAVAASVAKAHVRSSASNRTTLPSSSLITPSAFFCASGWLTRNVAAPSEQG